MCGRRVLVIFQGSNPRKKVVVHGDLSELVDVFLLNSGVVKAEFTGR